MEKPNEEAGASIAGEQAAIVRALREELNSLDPHSAAADGLRVQLAEECARLAQYEDRAATPHRPCVLVVEDDDIARGALANWLSESYEVVLARDGAEALELARARPPDAVIAYLEKPIDLDLVERELRSTLRRNAHSTQTSDDPMRAM
jgi:PleD family two-component response regulator